MSKKFLVNVFKNTLKYTGKKIKSIKEDKIRYTILNKEVYYDDKKNKYYVKLVTIVGLICMDITIDEIFSINSSILESLDINSRCYIYYVVGKLEDLANQEHNSIFTFHAISPHNQNIFIVKSLIDMSIHKWDIHEAYTKELYYNLDKPSIARFIEHYLSAKQLNRTQKNCLRLIK